MPIKLNKTLKILKQALVAKQNFIKTIIKILGRYSGRQRRWGGTRWATARVRAVPAGFAARAPRVREGEDDGGFRRGN
jgi:hypothetical protein